MQLPGSKNYKMTWLQFADSFSEGLYLTRPVDPVSLVSSYKRLKSLRFEFSKSGFNKKIDCTTYLDSWLKTKHFEYLAIQNGHNITTLPDSLNSQPLKYLEVHLDGIQNLHEKFTHLRSLEELCIISNRAISLGHSFKKLSKLGYLHIQAESITDLNEIWRLTNLKHLRLEISNLEHIPEQIYKLRKLKSLSLYGIHLKSIASSWHKLSQLEELNISISHAFKMLPKSLFSSSLKTLSIHSKADHIQLAFPSKFKLPYLEQLKISNITADIFPRITAPRLNTLSLKVGNTQPLSKFEDIEELKELTLFGNLSEPISALPSTTLIKYNGNIIAPDGEMDIRVWPALEKLSLSDSKEKVANLILNNNLQELQLRDCHLHDSFHHTQSKLKTFRLSNVDGLEVLNLLNKQSQLTFLSIDNCPELKTLNIEGGARTSLRNISITNCRKFERFPSTILLCPQLTQLRIGSSRRQILNKPLSKPGGLLKYLTQSDATVDERLALAYWLFDQKSYRPLDENIRTSTFKLFRQNNDDIFQCLIQELPVLNPNKTAFSDLDPEFISGKRIGIIGKTFGTKKSIKEEAKSIGLVPISKLEEVDFLNHW